MKYRTVTRDTIFQNCLVVQCNQCALLQINKRFSETEIEDYYKNVYDRDRIYNFDSNTFPGDNIWSVYRGRALAKLMIHMGFDFQSNPLVMDLGCGYGHLLFGFQQYMNGKCTIIGVEYDEKTKLVFDRFRWHFHYGGINDVYIPYENKVDILITSHVFEHVINPHEFLEKCKRMLSREGVLVWEMPNLNTFNLSCEQRHSPHICLWDMYSLRSILLQHEFEIIFLGTAGKKYTWLHKRTQAAKTLHKGYSILTRQSTEPAYLNPSHNYIGFELDTYGHNRRNIRLIAKKNTGAILRN